MLGAFYNRGLDLGDKEQDGQEFIVTSALEVQKVAEYLDCVRTAFLRSCASATNGHR